MPVGAVGGSAGSLVGHDADERAGASACPETDGAAGEVDVIGKVVPYTGGECGAPLGLATNAPVEGGEVRANSDFEFGKVGLEEHDLMF